MNEKLNCDIRKMLLHNLLKPNTYNEMISLSVSEKNCALMLFDGIEEHSLFTFRGIDKASTLDRFVFSDASGQRFDDCANYLFYFGDKARACIAERLQYFPSLNNVTLAQLLKLAQTASNTLTSISKESLFAEDNREFYTFFTDPNVSELLATLYKRFSHDSTAKLKLRNMLISFLHTAQITEFKDESAVVSTSSDFNEAKGFTNAHDGIIFLCWVPSPEERYVIRATPTRGYYDNLQRYGVPCLRRGLHDYECEISFLGAIFPHFIYGYYDTSQSVTVLNPHQFLHKRTLLSTVKNGIHIDQTKFKSELAKKTCYVRYGEIANTHAHDLTVDFVAAKSSDT